MAKAELVIIPAPGTTHLLSTVEFAKRLLDLHSHVSITILLMKPLTLTPNVDENIRSLAASDSRIRYINLPPVHPPTQPSFINSPEKFITLYIDSYKPHVKDTIINQFLSSDSVRLVGLVVDMFCSSMIDVAHELRLPPYIFFTASAGFLGFTQYLPTRHHQVGTEFKDSDPDSIISSYINPVPSSVLPSFAFHKEGGYASFLGHGRKFKESKGIIVNTFAELESHALNSLLMDHEMPPVYPVGPLIDLKGLNQSQYSDEADCKKIMKWLDDQPPSSVVFLCFGSLGCFDKSQVKEMAQGLERTGHRFLWSLRRPPQQGDPSMPSDYIDHDDILPEGFMKRIGGRGMICEWAPQVEILAHQAIGGFVSHCGWNSILESIWHAVPIATWPIYAEQQLNAFEMVRELGLAVEIKVDYRMGGGHLVMADEIERGIRCLMDGDHVVRKRVKDMGVKSRIALMDGGSSFTSFGRLLNDVLVLGDKS